MPILENPKKDMLFFFLPGIVSLLILKFFAKGIAFDWGLIIIAYYLADAGHVYTTVLRYKFDSKEKIKEVLYPFILFTVAIFTAIAFEVKAFWSLLIYATFLHNLKQAFGISSWYNFLTKGEKGFHKVLFYSVNVLSLFVLHFRSDLVHENRYPILFIFRYPNELFYKVTLFLVALGFICLIWDRFKNGKGIFARAYPLFMTGIYFYSFVLAKTMHEILIPLLITHGISYLALIQDSTKKIFSQNKFVSLLLLAIAGGFLDWFFLDEEFLLKYSLFAHHFFRAMIFGAIFTHYYLDGILWKKDHTDAQLIFKASDAS